MGHDRSDDREGSELGTGPDDMADSSAVAPARSLTTLPHSDPEQTTADLREERITLDDVPALYKLAKMFERIGQEEDSTDGQAMMFGTMSRICYRLAAEVILPSKKSSPKD